MILIGYSGHAYVVHSIFTAANVAVKAYCDNSEKTSNPFQLQYLGSEDNESALQHLKQESFFIAIGDNNIRRKVYQNLAVKGLYPTNAIHPSALIASPVSIDAHGVMIATGAIIHPLSKIEKGAIINTGAIVEHECLVGAFAHVGPGAILCGNVSIGEGTFVGAGAVIRQGIRVGNNVMIGMGAVVVKDVADNTTVMGIPAK
jgi:sugar O-acyltransferase (sialic acid O-acetyltransferase NeuD family)